jgi:cytochrome c oxidase cbb3-type subunit 2
METHHHHRTASPSHFRHAVSATLTIAALYAYFLLFIQVALIDNLAVHISSATLQVLTAIGGVTGCLAAGWKYDPEKARKQLTFGFAACLGAALLSLISKYAFAAVLFALISGTCVGWTALVLAMCLRPTVHLKRLGGACGLGVGLAYALCSQPLLYSASPALQTIFAAVLAAIGIGCSFRFTGIPSKPSASLDYRWPAFSLWCLVFFSAVFLDGAAAFIIRHSPLLRPDTWDGVVALQGNAFVHICAALLAGLALNRHQQAAAVAIALVIALSACLLLNESMQYFPAAHVLYTAAASTYSAVLIYYAARGGRSRAAAIFFIASGWFGSLCGSAVARSQDSVPANLAIASVLLAFAALLARYYWARYIRSTSGLGATDAG